jgi:hypothetical protein
MTGQAGTQAEAAQAASAAAERTGGAGAFSDPARAIAWLRTPQAVRSRCHALLALAEQDCLAHFTLQPQLLDAAADYVAGVIRANYPSLDIPYHARWRHFSAGGIDRWGALAGAVRDRAERARVAFELCVVSVLLDAGAGPGWHFSEPGGGVLTRSEGLAVASLHAFRAGLFSGEPDRPLRADAPGLWLADADALSIAFQVSPANPLAGLEGRAALMRNLGEVLCNRPDLFGAAEPRLGHLFDALAGRAEDGALPAATLLTTLLDAFAPIWPPRPAPGGARMNGTNLGDVWHHPAAAGPGLTDGLVPFHKLSQWLTYSLVEVFEQAGIHITGLDALTGLPEYRNGGLLLDLGVIALRDPALAAGPLPVDHPAVVEWRALTVALLDRLAPPVRARLGLDEAALPLARMLEGGTWAAGRQIARARRADGAPPLRVISDGTVF